MKPRSPIARVSKKALESGELLYNSTIKRKPKKLAADAQSGRRVFSTITKKPKAIKKVNPERLAKRRKSYAQKLAAYKRSETYLLVAQRSRGFCEMIDCMERDGLHHHHRTYARFGGNELPEDIQVLCKAHHDLVESQHPTRNRNYSSIPQGQ